MSTLQYMSDLHLERVKYDFVITKAAPILVLAGDIGRFCDYEMTILGCTMHSHIAAGYTKLTNDFARIKEWSVAQHNGEHETDLAWLKQSLLDLKQEEPKRRVIIVTHYAPIFDRVCHPKNENNALSQCFSSHSLANL